MAVLLGVAAAVFSGAGDYFGGIAGRRGRIVAVGIWAHVVGLITVLALTPLVSGAPTARDLAWGSAAGVSGGLGILALYRGFAAGDMAIVSPVAAVGAAGWPVLFALATGDRPGGLPSLGLVVGLGAIWTVGRSPQVAEEPRSRRAGVRYGLVAGLGFGGLLLMLSFTAAEAGIWPLLPARASGAVVLLLLAAGAHHRVAPLATTLPPSTAAGVLTVLGNGAFILGTQEGSLAVVSVLAAMFPAATVLLARLFLAEELGRRRRAGMALALLAVGLVAAG